MPLKVASGESEVERDRDGREASTIDPLGSMVTVGRLREQSGR